MTRLANLTWVEVDIRTGQEPVLLVPLGSTEQHGPHLPLGTDTSIAMAVASAAAARLPGSVVAPAVAYGSSGEHQSFQGTLSIGAAATELLLVELGRSAGATFAQVVLVSTHGGNAEPVQRAVARLRDEGRKVRAWGPRWEGDAHAGRTETSLMLVIAPEQVRLGAAAAGDTRPLASLLPELRAGGVRSVSPNGVLGDPTEATPKEGRELLQAAVDQLVAFVRRPETGEEE
ncbi:MAG: mycofactocin biosynthesis peptidyl-dipeptidase MftE [Acidimicrobiales bacterium]